MERKLNKYRQSVDRIAMAVIHFGVVVLVVTLAWVLYLCLWAVAPIPAEGWGCALDNCPTSWQVEHYANGGKRYYANYPKDSFAYWNSYCTEAEGSLSACK